MHHIKKTIHLYDEQGLPHRIEWKHGQAEGIRQFMRLTLTTEIGFFKQEKNGDRGLRRSISILGVHYRMLNQYAESYDSLWSYSPLINFFFDQYFLHPIHKAPLTIYATVGEDLELLAKIFDDFITAIRRNATGLKLMAKTRNWESKTIKAIARLKGYVIDSLVENRDIYIVQLALYSKDGRLSKEEIQSLATYSQHGIDRSSNPEKDPGNFEILRAQRDLIFSRIRDKPSIFGGLLFYFWRMDFTPYVGYQLWLSFVFRRSQFTDQQSLGEQVKKYVEGVAKEKGACAFLSQFSVKCPALTIPGSFSPKDLEFFEGVIEKIVPSTFWNLQLAAQKLPSPGVRMFDTGRGQRTPRRIGKQSKY